MKGIAYPEISSMSNAQIGGYLSDTATAELNAFKTRVERLKYVVQATPVGAITLDQSRHDYSANITVPTGYTTVGIVGVHVDDLTGTAPTRCCLRGERTNGNTVEVYFGEGAYSNGAGTSVAHVLFRRSS